MHSHTKLPSQYAANFKLLLNRALLPTKAAPRDGHSHAARSEQTAPAERSSVQPRTISSLFGLQDSRALLRTSWWGVGWDGLIRTARPLGCIRLSYGRMATSVQDSRDDTRDVSQLIRAARQHDDENTHCICDSSPGEFPLGGSWLGHFKTASSTDSQTVKTGSKQRSEVIWQHRWALSHFLDLVFKHSVTVRAAVRLWKSSARSRQWINVPNILLPSNCPVFPLLSLASRCQPTMWHYGAALGTTLVTLVGQRQQRGFIPKNLGELRKARFKLTLLDNLSE